MSEKIEVIAIIMAKLDKGTTLKQELLKLIEPSRAEAGCEHYELQEDTQNPDRFFMIETWTNKPALEEHIKTPHFQGFIKNTEALLAGVDPAIINTVS